MFDEQNVLEASRNIRCSQSRAALPTVFPRSRRLHRSTIRNSKPQVHGNRALTRRPFSAGHLESYGTMVQPSESIPLYPAPTPPLDLLCQLPTGLTGSGQPPSGVLAFPPQSNGHPGSRSENGVASAREQGGSPAFTASVSSGMGRPRYSGDGQRPNTVLPWYLKTKYSMYPSWTPTSFLHSLRVRWCSPSWPFF